MVSMLRQVLAYAGVVGMVVAGVVVARSSQAGLSGYAGGYLSECVQEGCSREEVRELYKFGSYQEECIGEGWCSFIERQELYAPAAFFGGLSDGEPEVEQMEAHFCAIGRQVWWMSSTRQAGPGTPGSSLRCN